MEKKLTYNKYDAGQSFLFALFMPFLVSLVYMFVVYIVASIVGANLDNITENSVYVIFATLVSPIAFVLTFIFVNKISKTNFIVALKVKQKFNVKYFLITIVLSLICVFGVSNFVNLFDAVLAKIGFSGNYEIPIPMYNFGYLILDLIILAVLPAICEELIFRGIIFSGLRQYGEIKAVFLSATLFMLIHSSVEQTVYPFFVGVVLALLMLKTNNIIYPIILHFLNNAIVVVANYISYMSSSASVFTLTVYNILFAIALLILSILCVLIVFKIILKLKIKSKQNEDVDKNKDDYPNTFLYVGIIGAVIIWIFDLISGFIA